MSSAMQVLPLVVLIIYGALTIFGIVLALRFVTAHERIASALEDAAYRLRKLPEKKITKPVDPDQVP
jgi:hypothetical protein